MSARTILRSTYLIRPVCAALVVSFLAGAAAPAEAQGSLKRKAILLAVCGGGAWGGYRLGDKLANIAIAKANLTGVEADKMRLSFKIGVAAAACGASALLVGTVYDGLSKRDREARAREMEAALADAEPSTRQYVLPDSGKQGRLETLAAERDGNRECRLQLDTLGGASEPAAVRQCRKDANDNYEVDLGV